MNFPNFSLDGEVALITGGSRGIGRAIAQVFAEVGADIAICSLGGDTELKEAAEQIRQTGRRGLALRTDISLKNEVDIMIQAVLSHFGKIDILVNNAGINLQKPLLETPEADWDRLFNIDLKGYYLCAQAAGKEMKKRNKGNIINIASQWAFKASANMGAYSIAKAGVVMLTRVLSRELGPYHIRANTIAPGVVRTDFSLGAWKDPERLRHLESMIPLGRIAETADIVGAAQFLASPASEYITGQTIIIDGGGLA